MMESRIKEYLQSEDKELKHEAWNYVEAHYKELGKDFIIEMLKFPDTGTRYRAWNFVKKLVEEKFLTVEECKALSPYFLEMLKDNNVVVRALSWYVTLILLIDIGIIDKEKVVKEYSRILRDLNSLKVNDARFKNYEEFVEDVYSSICNIPYYSSKGECELLEEIERMKNEYSEIIKLTDVPLINDIKGNIMKEIELGKEVGKLGIDDLFDVVDKFSFIIDGKCGDKTCKDVFPLRDVIEGKINPLKEMIENPKEFCKKYGLELGCDEYKPLLVKIREVVEDDEESKVFYSILYLNWISNQFKTMVNTIQLPSEIDIKVRMKAELERITCISS